MKKIINPWGEIEGYNCFGCAPQNPSGLHMEFYEDGDDIVSFWHPDGKYQGWLNTLHGAFSCIARRNMRMGNHAKASNGRSYFKNGNPLFKTCTYYR